MILNDVFYLSRKISYHTSYRLLKKIKLNNSEFLLIRKFQESFFLKALNILKYFLFKQNLDS